MDAGAGLALAAGAALGGVAGLALAMERHHADSFGHAGAPGRRRAARVAGWTLLAAAFGACVARDGWAFGPLLWVSLVAAAGLAVTGLNAWAPRLLPAAGGGAGAAALAAALALAAG